MLDEPGLNPQTSRARFGRSGPASGGEALEGTVDRGVVHRICKAAGSHFHIRPEDRRVEGVMG